MSRLTDAELYRRGAATLVASWEEYARESVGAVLVRRPGVAIGVFPHEPERSIYNNALLDRDLAAVEPGDQHVEGGVVASGEQAGRHLDDPQVLVPLDRRQVERRSRDAQILERQPHGERRVGLPVPAPLEIVAQRPIRLVRLAISPNFRH